MPRSEHKLGAQLQAGARDVGRVGLEAAQLGVHGLSVLVESCASRPPVRAGGSAALASSCSSSSRREAAASLAAANCGLVLTGCEAAPGEQVVEAAQLGVPEGLLAPVARCPGR